jgi:hypothetical protein
VAWKLAAATYLLCCGLPAGPEEAEPRNKKHKYAATYLTTEYLFAEPFLNDDVMLTKLLVSRFGSDQMPLGLEAHHRQLLCAESQMKLKNEDIEILLTATSYQTALPASQKHMICIDPRTEPFIYSNALFKARHQDRPVLPPTSLGVENDIDIILDILPARLRSRLDAHSYGSNNKITEIVVDVTRQPQLMRLPSAVRRSDDETRPANKKEV